MNISRREFLQSAGALVVSFSLPWEAFGQVPPNPKYEELDAWLAVGADGKVTAYCGKVELGTGIQTAFGQLVADELDVPFERVTVLMGDTELCPDQGPTVGSLSMYRGGPQVRQAAAEARQTLLAMAATRMGTPVERLSVKGGVVSSTDGKSATYAELIGNKKFSQKLARKVQPKSADKHAVIGQSIPRVELPGKVFGSHVYVQNLRFPGMLHGRVVRPATPDAMMASVDESSVRNLPGNVRVLQKGGFVGVVADREEQAIRAARELKVTWKPGPALPSMKSLPDAVRARVAEDKAVVSIGNVDTAFGSAKASLSAEYFVPHQMHASIGPSCVVADVRADGGTIWSPTQSSFLTRNSVAAMLGMAPDKLRIIWTEGSGCYGQNGADDCTADAALMSQLAGRPVRLQWMRHDEHGNEPKGVAMAMTVKGGLDEKGDIVAWDYQVWSPPHSSRPGGDGGGNTLAGEQLGKPGRIFPVGADRNAKCTYVFPNNRTTLHQSKGSPSLRVSALRGLGSPQNTFANESFIDEMAALAKADPIAFRIKHLKDERAIAVLQEVAKLSKWDARPSPQRVGSLAGRGVGYCQYDNYSTYVAVVVRVTIDRASGKVRVPYVAVAHDCGLIVNPDGVKNQIEGNVVQAISRALLEEVQFDFAGVTSLDWSGYPILRFSDVPAEIAMTLINRPDKIMVGAGEGATSPVAAAIANAIFDATGKRLRTVPFNPGRVKAALA
ncbi:MAG: molybdopterin cofactor-binding domain-containing protein [Betaproteobacteria bacterium]